MAIDSAVSQTAVEAWDKRWATSEGRADWLEPHPAVVAILPELHARGARRVLDLIWFNYVKVWIRGRLPWWLINLGVADKGPDCESSRRLASLVQSTEEID
jgi:hypothetical protein